MLLWEPPGDSLVHPTNLSSPVCDSDHLRRRRALTSVLLALFCLVLVTDNVPIHSVRDGIGSVEDRLLGLTGAQQVWGMFAPDPPRSTGHTFVRFFYRDGSTGTWDVPRHG